MTTQSGTSSSSLLKGIHLLIAASLLFTPLKAFGEGMTFRQIASAPQVNLGTPHNVSQNRARLGVDEDGNVMVKYGDLTATFIYDPDSHQESRDLPRLASSGPDLAMPGSIAVKISINF